MFSRPFVPLSGETNVTEEIAILSFKKIRSEEHGSDIMLKQGTTVLHKQRDKDFYLKFLQPNVSTM